MDFELDADQSAIVAAVEALLAQHAGPARAIELQPKGEYDGTLEAALAEAGFLDVARDSRMGGLAAALVVEAVARAGGVVSAAGRALVAAALDDEPVAGAVALARAGERGPVRFGADARTLFVLAADEARRIDLEPGLARPVRSNFGFPFAVLSADAWRGGRSLGPGSAERLEAWWRVALAVEAVGAMAAALQVTVDYLVQRRQFGRAIGSFQGVQHRLAECKIQLEGSRWLAYEAAHHGAPAEQSATAAAHALAAAGRLFRDTHQLSGAIGFTREHDLHVWTMRLKALQLELGGPGAHRRAAARARWQGPGS